MQAPKDLNFKHDEEFLKKHLNLRCAGLRLFTDKGEKVINRVETWVTKRCSLFLGNALAGEIDGTFLSSPNLFAQTITILGGTNEADYFYPCAYAFATGKFTNFYQIVLEDLRNFIKKEHDIDWKPNLMICDFELGIKKAIKNFDPDIKIRNCLFHFIQMIQRFIMKGEWPKTSQGAKSYKEAWYQGELLSCLPLLKIDDIVPAYNDVKTLFKHPRMIALGQHLENNYLSKGAM